MQSTYNPLKQNQIVESTVGELRWMFKTCWNKTYIGLLQGFNYETEPKTKTELNRLKCLVTIHKSIK